jgi:hypothetical protein
MYVHVYICFIYVYVTFPVHGMIIPPHATGCCAHQATIQVSKQIPSRTTESFLFNVYSQSTCPRKKHTALVKDHLRY